jgi:biotin carboxylase
VKTVWIVSGGAEAVPGIRRVRELGYHVVVSDLNPEAPGFAEADDQVRASTYDVDATVAAAERYNRTVRPLDGVLSMAADVPMTVAAVADSLGLPGIPLETARLAADKLAMKRRFAEAGIAIPWFAPLESADELRLVAAERGLPLVIKPVDGRGARGVLRLDDGVDLDWAFRHALGQSPSGRVMVEEYLPGPQISTESVLLGDEAATPGFIDRNYEHLGRFAPFVVENGGEQPSVLAAAEHRKVADLAVAAARALGIERGTAKGDLVLADGEPRVIEVAARLSGGWMSTDQVPLATGVDLVGTAVRLAAGDQVSLADVEPRELRGVAVRYFFPPPGQVREIRGSEEASRLPWVHRLGFFVEPGEILEQVTDHTKRAGFVITTGASRDEAVARAERVVAEVRIVTEPVR